MIQENLFNQALLISRKEREDLKKQNSFVVWFTGLSGSGKSTLAALLDQGLYQKGYHTYVLDGDNIRMGINKDLNFSNEARTENIRRIAEVVKLMLDAGLIVITAFISPFESDRANAKAIIGSDNFIEVFVDCPLSICEERDTKGLYKKARAGLIKDFTGIDSPFEVPKQADITLHTHQFNTQTCIAQIVDYLNIQSKVRLPNTL
jgi:adenylyl-sulfate kinase